MYAPQASNPEWYYESNGSPSGPVDASVIAGMLRANQLQPYSRVWKQGMSDWTPVGNVPQFQAATAPAPAAASPVAAPGAGWAGTGPRPEEVSTIILLGVVTLGIYPLIRFYQASKSYLAMLPGRASNFDTLFWVYVGLSVLGAVTAGFGIGVLLFIAAIVVGVMVLNESMAARTELVRNRALPVSLTTPETHRILWILGMVGTFVVLGLILLVVQAAKFFEDHNRIAQALSGTTPQAFPAPAPVAAAPVSTPSAPAALPPVATSGPAFCVGCGQSLGSGTRFCPRCGKPAS